MPERFHWIVPRTLAGMALPGLAAPLEDDLRALIAEGVRAIATLTERPLPPVVAALSIRHFPIADFDVPTIEQTEEFCAWVDARIAAGEPVAVHCFAGLGRTGTMLACWLVREPEAAPERVLERIRGFERGYVQTAAQEAFVTVWATEWRRRNPRP